MWDFSAVKFAFGTDRSLPLQNPPLAFGTNNVAPEELRDRKQSLAAAIVLWWDESGVTVRCPFCDREHFHGFRYFARDEKSGRRIQDANGRYTYRGPSPSRCESRVAHCGFDIAVRPDYIILFPFETDDRVTGLCFELEHLVDEEGAPIHRFRTVGLDPLPRRIEQVAEDEAVREIRIRLQELRVKEGDYTITTELTLWEDTEKEIITQSATTFVIAASVNGKVGEMKALLSRSPNPTSLLQVRTKDGESLLTLAAREGHRDMVEYLLSQGLDVDAVDSKGRTPLMTAALWVRPVVVDRLLRAGAKRTAKDKAGMTAGHLAEQSDANDEERYLQCPIYSEIPFVTNRNRKLVKGLLGHNTTTASKTRPKAIPLEDVTDAFFYKSATTDTMSLVIPITGIHISSPTKTAAFLHRGSPFPVVSSLSGRSGPHDQEFLEPGDGFERLNPQFWMPLTLRVANEFDFAFESHGLDEPTIPGSYYAGHAEAMLMCFLVKRNYLFRAFELGTGEIVNDLSEYEITVEDDFLQLFLLQPRRRYARIFVSKKPCSSCTALRDDIRSKLGIEIGLKVIEERSG